MEIVSPRWRARRRNPASRHAAREKGGVFTSPCSQTSGLSIGLTKISYVVYDILSSGADRAAIKPVQPRFQPLEGQHNAQAKLRGLRYLAGQPSASACCYAPFNVDPIVLLLRLKRVLHLGKPFRFCS